MKRTLKIAIGVSIGFVIYRLVTEYLRPVRIGVEEQWPPVPVPEPTAEPDPPIVEPTALNLNAAEAAALTGLPGVGPTLAARIVAYREENGPFGDVDELSQVQGVGAALVEQVRPLVTI